MKPSLPTSPPNLPLVVQVGFSGSRNLFPKGSSFTDEQKAGFLQVMENELVAQLKQLPATLKLDPHHFLCGISQVAIGGDTLFTRACATLPISQRVFLPQTRDEFLSATGSHGVPDFTDREKAIAQQLLASPHIIQEWLASDSSERDARFQDTSLEILRASDVLICLLREDADDKPGGTKELMTYGVALGKPVLEMRVEIRADEARVRSHWRFPEKEWIAPALIPGLENAVFKRKEASPNPGVPVHAKDYLAALKDHGSIHADDKQRGFRNTAVKVIGAHLLATLFAVIALSFSKELGSIFLGVLLSLELFCLAGGFLIHHKLHKEKTPEAWTTHRLTAEIARSVGALHEMHLPLDYLFTLPLPRAIRPLLETINVLHLAATKGSNTPWPERLERYVGKRLDGLRGQIHYFTINLNLAKSRKKRATAIFHTATILAFLSTAAKLCITFESHAEGDPHTLPHILGALAILLPVIAVGALSLAAAFDLEARVHTYRDTLNFLLTNRPLYQHVTTERAFIHLVLETETNLLGEITNWASRRSFTTVT